jgi:hypothetical protein
MRVAEVVVVAPRWWAGGQPPPKIKMQNYRQMGFFGINWTWRLQVQNPCPPLEFLGDFLDFLGRGKT